MKKETWGWSERRRAYVLEEFNEAFNPTPNRPQNRPSPELHAVHYKDAIVLSANGNLWLYTPEHFEDLISFVRRARRALFHSPAVKDEKDLARRRARQRAARKRSKRTVRAKR